MDGGHSMADNQEANDQEDRAVRDGRNGDGNRLPRILNSRVRVRRERYCKTVSSPKPSLRQPAGAWYALES